MKGDKLFRKSDNFVGAVFAFKNVVYDCCSDDGSIDLHFTIGFNEARNKRAKVT